MKKMKWHGSFSGAVGLMLVLAVVGSVFLNIFLVSQSLKPDQIRQAMDKMNIEQVFSERMKSNRLYTKKMDKLVDQMTNSKEMQELINRHSDYVTKYMLESIQGDNITQTDLHHFMKPYIKQTMKKPVNEQQLNQTTEEWIESINMMSLFPSAQSYIPGKLNQRIQLITNSLMSIVLGLVLLVFMGILFFAALPQNYLCFLGFGLFVAGILSGWMMQLGMFFSTILFANPLLQLIFEQYQQRMEHHSYVMVLLGGLLFLSGIATLCILMILQNNQQIGKKNINPSVVSTSDPKHGI